MDGVMQTFRDWVRLPENATAQAAVWRAAQAAARGILSTALNPLFLHGPTGSGKSHLGAALVRRASQQRQDLVVSRLAATAFVAGSEEGTDVVGEMQQADLIVLEDLQQLPSRSVAALVDIMDKARSQGRLVMLTANAGPAQLKHLPYRLTSRCGAGLVVGLQPLARSSRLLFLQDRARRRRVDQDTALTWLADRLSGSARELEGAVVRLQSLTRLLGRPPALEELEEHFRPEAEASQITVDGIVRRVGRYFQVSPGELRAAGRARQAVLPRQVGMYLARRLTPLSLQQIGAYFGGRDHTTVLHACRKVEQALSGDTALECAIRHLDAELA